jgi:RimJ/RimL family protein N-acetyltransferase
MPGALFKAGDNVNLRTIEEEDLEFLRDNINNPEVRTHLTTRKPVNLEQEKEFFEEVVSDEESVNLAICNNEDIVGLVSLEEYSKDLRVAEIGIWVDPEFHRNGYSSEAAELIIEYGFNELNYHKITARAHSENQGSNKIWHKLGFEQEGELREQAFRESEFCDINLYAILRREWNQ